jgi:hypothetical protein
MRSNCPTNIRDCFQSTRASWQRCLLLGWTVAATITIGSCTEPSSLQPICVPIDQTFGGCTPSTGGGCVAGAQCLLRCGALSNVGGCQVPSHRDATARARRVLIEGFGVQEVPLRRILGQELPFARFEWKVPEQTAIAHCIVFGCEPVIREGRIENKESCVLRDITIATPAQQVDLSAFEPPFLHSQQSGLTRGRHRPPVFVALGCLLYSKTELFGATPLEAVELSALPNPSEIVNLVSCEEAEQGLCTLEQPLSGFGFCSNNKCRPMCTTAQDCSDLAESVFDEDAGDSTRADTMFACTSQGMFITKQSGDLEARVCVPPDLPSEPRP